MTKTPFLTDPEAQAIFDSLRDAVHNQNDQAVMNGIGGHCLSLGAAILKTARGEMDRATFALDKCEPATRLMLATLWGSDARKRLDMDIAYAYVFAVALLQNPFAIALMKEWSLGPRVSQTPEGHPNFQVKEAKQVIGSITAQAYGDVWCFDLLPLYAKASELLGIYIDSEFGGDFGAFVTKYSEGWSAPIDMALVRETEAQFRDKGHAGE